MACRSDMASLDRLSCTTSAIGPRAVVSGPSPLSSDGANTGARIRWRARSTLHFPSPSDISEVRFGANQPSTTAPVRASADFVRTGEIARCMAGAAVTEPLDQIGAAVPRITLIRVWLEATALEVEFLPAEQQVALAEGPTQPVLRRLVAGGLQ